jgi:glycosyltransferase involved in cell wall biosynthesis
VCLFAGNVYDRVSQPEANRTLVHKLNGLGQRLRTLGAELYVLGPGEVGGLDPDTVRHLGSVSYDECWRYLRHADVGIVVSAGRFMHNNESTKIYHYLRAGLPVVSESGFPNDAVVDESGLGRVVKSGDLDALAACAAKISWGAEQRDRAVRYIRDRHTWDHRAGIYDALLRETASDGG